MRMIPCMVAILLICFTLAILSFKFGIKVLFAICLLSVFMFVAFSLGCEPVCAGEE